MKYIKAIYGKIPHRYRNRYAFTLCVFILWMSFFDKNNIISQISLKLEVNELNKTKEKLFVQIKDIRYRHDKLLNDPKEQERFAREKYWMKRPDEDIFIMVGGE